jgi:hypothetical protein
LNEFKCDGSEEGLQDAQENSQCVILTIPQKRNGIINERGVQTLPKFKPYFFPPRQVTCLKKPFFIHLQIILKGGGELLH